MTKDYYRVLDVSRQAAPDEIRSAYRRRARELHPDVSGFDSKPFIELQQAYTVLGDPTLRAAYDREREAVAGPVAGLRKRTGSEPFREVEPISGFRDISVSGSFGSFQPSFDELFDRLWSNFERVTRPKAERLESMTVEVPLSVAEASTGGHVRLFVPARIACPRCRGRGEVGFYECWQCRGLGALTVEYPVNVSYPPGLRGEYVVRLALDELGIHNFYLTVRFRPSDSA